MQQIIPGNKYKSNNNPCSIECQTNHIQDSTTYKCYHGWIEWPSRVLLWIVGPRGNIEHEALDRTLRLTNSTRTHSDKERLDKDLSLRSRDRTSHLGPRGNCAVMACKDPWPSTPSLVRLTSLQETWKADPDRLSKPVPLQFLTDLERNTKFLYRFRLNKV